MGLAQFIFHVITGYDHNWVLFCNIDRITNWGLSGQCGPNYQKKVPNWNCRNRDFFSASFPHPHHGQVFPQEICFRCVTVYRVFNSRSSPYFFAIPLFSPFFYRLVYFSPFLSTSFERIAISLHFWNSRISTFSPSLRSFAAWSRPTSITARVCACCSTARTACFAR